MIVKKPIFPFILFDRRAPECFNDSYGGVTSKSDIFSFGIILWELITQKRPWDGLSEFQVLSHFMNATLYIRPITSLAPKAPERTAPEAPERTALVSSFVPDDLQGVGPQRPA